LNRDLEHIDKKLTLGILQGPNTFGADAARSFAVRYPELFNGNIVYYDTAEEALSFKDGRADAICPPQQMTRTGFHPGMQAYIAGVNSNLYVIGEIEHAYHCSLLVKPGAVVDQIQRVLGHTGSITQSRAWLEHNLPKAEIVIVDTSSMDAAKTVADGDGSVASIGTKGMAEEFGLEERHKDVDGGSVGSYWAVTPQKLFSSVPSRVVVSGRFNHDGRIGAIICALANAGFYLETVFTSATGQRLYEYDYAMRFRGTGPLATVEAAVATVPSARLAGAFVAKD
jgi:prephenate dehydratase